MEPHLIISGLVSAAPGLVIWIIALTLSTILMKKSSSKLKRLLIVGSSLMLLSSLLEVPKPAITHNVLENGGFSAVKAASVISYVNLFTGLISLAGIICLFYAVWKKFNSNPQQEVSVQQE